LNDFFPRLANRVKDLSSVKYEKWTSYCENIKKNNPIIDKKIKKNPIDLYYFMERLGELSSKKDILVTDAGSNYYIGGQAWTFNKNQKEIASTSNAAMGLSLPLSIGASVADKKKSVLSVTGDGSIELNIQELATIAHYNLNIKTFVINNGGYVSMKKWQSNFFDGNILDDEESTGTGTMNFKKIADAYKIRYLQIKKISDIKKITNKVLSNKYPYLIEVFTDPNQKIYGKEF